MEHTVTVRLFGALALSWASLFLVSCSLIESSKEEVTSQTPPFTDPVSAAVVRKGDYLESCREKDVPIPPDWNSSSSEWQHHGNLHTILLTSNSLDQTPVDDTSFARVWSYASPDLRGACIALGRSSGTFQVICQSATTGHACFWSNNPSSSSTSWNPETTEVPIASLRDPVQGFAPDTVACTECHRGNNAFLYAPDDPTWATVLRPEQPRPTFTTRVEQSSHHGQLTFGSTTISYPRFIPIGGTSMALTNPLPTGPACSGSCHELHGAILRKNHTAEGYVKAPRPMGPQCAANSPDDDPTRNCYQR